MSLIAPTLPGTSLCKIPLRCRPTYTCTLVTFGIYILQSIPPPFCGSITCLGRINMHRGGRRRERRLRKMGKLHEEKNLQTLGCGVWKIQRSCASEGYACMIMRGFEIRMHCAGPTCARKTRWKKRMITGNVYSGSI